MKLLYRITLRASTALLVIFAVWGTIFYFVIIDEINDEADDSLEDYSEYIITRALTGENLPDADNGTNNSYFITEVSHEYAMGNPSVRFLEEEVYIHSKKETEPARILKTIFRDREERYHELTVMIPTIEKKDLKETILLWVVMLYMGLLLSILAVNAVVIRRSLRPLYALLDWLDDFSLDRELPALDTKSGITEFNKLGDSLVGNARRQIEMYEQQRLFIGHASHELQTPIAVAANRLELLANDPELTEAQLEQILKTRRSLEDVAKLNKTLLLLTKIENRQFAEHEEIDVNEMLRSLGRDFSEAYGHMKLEFSIDERAALRVGMNRTLASVLFGNLIKNAFVHNLEGGRVTVEITAGEVTISNSAASGALNPEYIFRRFYQGEKTEGSAGLGLSLAESIAKLYGITISYLYGQELHIFKVKFSASMIISS